MLRRVCRSYVVRVGAVLALLLTVATTPAAAQSTGELEQQARDLFDRQRYTEAVEILQNLLKAQPDSRSGNILLPFALARAGNTRAAIDQARRSLQVVPGNTQLELLLAGLLAQETATQPEAVRRFQAVRQRDPKNALARIGLGEVARMQGRPYDAIAAFRAATELDPNDHRLWVRLGQQYAVLGDLAEARRNFERAYALAPSSVDAVRSLAILAEVDDRPGDALRHYRELQRLYPTDTSVLVAVRNAELLAAELQFPVPLDELERMPLQRYFEALPENARQLHFRKEQLEATRRRSLARFLPSFYFSPSHSTIKRTPQPALTDESDAVGFSFGWNLADIFADPFQINISGMQADFEAVKTALMNDVSSTYYQRQQNIVQYRQLQRTLALDPRNAQIRQNKQTVKIAILSFTERLRILTGLP